MRNAECKKHTGKDFDWRNGEFMGEPRRGAYGINSSSLLHTKRGGVR